LICKAAIEMFCVGFAHFVEQRMPGVFCISQYHRDEFSQLGLKAV